MTTSDLAIRPYEPSDAEAVLAVHEVAFRASNIEFVAEAAVDEELQDVSGTYSASGDAFLVGTVEGEVIATGGYRRRPDRGRSVAEVAHVRVHPDHQRRGVATAIMAEIEARAQSEGYEALVLETHEDLVAAQALYEALGYEEMRRESHPVSGDAMIHYAKPL